ncbi:phage GP46 family protein [Burkholderia pseudomallei]|uniref:phage GP46 family protein n=1 Tax=Burkholderia pseudomallei TaxID=28450 RepID=UPI000F09585C|nr:phage GP46 family protein [Burkholderia pseudomallei]CAJ6322276.1 MuV-like tail protein [Burkholderia pseudomallei]CAJ6473580.1 MuV-like tail protein [Burkholderia pseudomallei]VBJ46685.1 MuV-like tail protein [Burkholderia pseudomallei]VCJ26924.1 MuV-like tail protein [Burkholderia pseudomallei]VCJ26998.1 MuV-like tail protein [Burkholderia pseudomallei]
MIDIRTISTTSAAVLALPFDWSVVRTGRASNGAWHDYSNPCVAVGHHVEPLEVLALELDDSLCTAVILSLFTDRRAGPDVTLPHNQRDRRGWCGDEFAMPAGDAPRDESDEWGSHLWLCYVTKSSVDMLERARFAAWESLQWMVRTDVASRVDVTATWAGSGDERLALRPRIFQGNPDRPVYDVLWGTSLRRADA